MDTPSGDGGGSGAAGAARPSARAEAGEAPSSGDRLESGDGNLSGDGGGSAHAAVTNDDDDDGDVAAEGEGAASAVAPPAGGFTCCVCLESLPRERLAPMPCCHKKGSTTLYCKDCIAVVCEMAAEDGIPALCPSCRACIEFDPATGAVTRGSNTGQCLLCRQRRELVEATRCCAACNLGRRLMLVYECDRCHQLQRIPHPMWRYQPTSDAFGTETWACHRRCGTFTHWRIHPSALEHVPPQEWPASWGGRERWVAEVRHRRELRRDGDGDGDRGGGGGGGLDLDAGSRAVAGRGAGGWMDECRIA